MNTDQTTLLRELKARSLAVVTQLEALLKSASEEQLQRNPAPGKWSVTQVLWHLNFYADHYLSEIEKQLDKAPLRESSHPLLYESSWLGNYFVKAFSPREGMVTNPMPAMRKARPEGHTAGPEQIARFLEAQQKLEALLDRTASVDMRNIKVPTTLGPLLRIGLGDTYRFYIAHQERHLIQILRTLMQVQGEAAA